MEWLSPLFILCVGMAIVSNLNTISSQLSRIEDLLHENNDQNVKNGLDLGSISSDIYGLRKKIPNRIDIDPVTGSETIRE